MGRFSARAACRRMARPWGDDLSQMFSANSRSCKRLPRVHLEQSAIVTFVMEQHHDFRWIENRLAIVARWQVGIDEGDNRLQSEPGITPDHAEKSGQREPWQVPRLRILEVEEAETGIHIGPETFIELS